MVFYFVYVVCNQPPKRIVKGLMMDQRSKAPIPSNPQGVAGKLKRNVLGES